MKHIRILAVLSGFFLLNACATQSNYNNMLHSWVGVPSDHLVEIWGGPDSIYTKNDGSKVFTYNSWHTTPRPAYGFSASSGGAFGYGASMPFYETEARRCRTSFFISSNRVVTDYKFDGDYCYATEDLMAQKSFGWTQKRP
jgi:hypothetical protein